MNTQSEIKFNRIISEGFHKILKPLGFKKKANNFYLRLDELGQIINVQKSVFGTKDQISFTINTGLFLPEHWRGLIYNQNKEIPTFPTEPECLIRKRIGKLRNQHDTWYDIQERTDEAQLISEMRFNISNYILPYFQRYSTKDKLLKILDTEKTILAPFGKLIAYAELGYRTKAINEYRFLLKEHTNESFLNTLREYGKKISP
ncbi:MAG TPA: hypothetical protein DDY13_20355 [Cytophagales bacterium]|nr:hypothetical protein [Cytophagales bacterium]